MIQGENEFCHRQRRSTLQLYEISLSQPLQMEDIEYDVICLVEQNFLYKIKIGL